MKHYFITRMPNEPGALHRAAEIVRKYNGNISRIHYDYRIDPHTTFFEISVDDSLCLENIRKELQKIGYLQETLEPVGFLRFNVYLPNKPGALFDFLNYTTSANANIAFLDFDEKGKHPDRLTVCLTIERSNVIDRLLNALKSRYRIEILEYDPRGRQLDKTVFYLEFAQKIRELLGSAEDRFLLHLLNDINHIVQELSNLNKEPTQVFNSIISTGKRLRNSTGKNFYSDVQVVTISKNIKLFCFQLPCGGNIFVLSSDKKSLMIDTGFGIYHDDVLNMFQYFGLGDITRLDRILLTHADADHAGAAGMFSCPSFMHKATSDAIDIANRAYGSRIETSVLEEVYTKLINLFSHFSPPEKREIFPDQVLGLRSIFPIIYKFNFYGIEIEVLESLGGHIFGQVYFLLRKEGIIFTGDSLINFDSLTEDKKEFANLATILMTSVNVDSHTASKEREALLGLIRDIDKEQVSRGKRCIVCGGHGAISVLGEEGRLVVPDFLSIDRYNRG